MSDPRWTVITGASSGIGTEIARIFAAQGRSLVLVARRQDRLDALADEIGRERVVTLALDLEQPDAGGRLVHELDARGIVLDTLVNNAGFGLRGRFATMPAADQAAMVELNIATLTKLCRLVVPGLIARRRGGILNVASTAAFQPVAYMAVYAATKAYVLSFSEALHEEVRQHGVRVTALCPGPTATEFTIRADMEKSKLFKHAMSAVEVAEQAVAGYEAGHAIVVTGAANRIGSVAVRLAPRALVRRAVGWLQG